MEFIKANFGGFRCDFCNACIYGEDMWLIVDTSYGVCTKCKIDNMTKGEGPK